MAYATKDDIEELYGADALALVADRDGDGTPELAAVDSALAMASDEIDSYLAVRYVLPLDETPSLLVQLNVDVALYRLAQTADVLSDEHRRRYEDAMGTLKRLSDGKQRLVLPPDPLGEDDTDPLNEGPQPIVTGGPERDFTRDKMKDL